MKKKKYLPILVMIVTLFSYCNGVEAAQELTCLYEKAWDSDKVLLIQYSDGTRKIFKNNKNVDIEDENWYESNASPNNWDDTVEKDEDGNLKVCPRTKKTSKDGKGTVTFYGNDEGDKTLEKGESIIKEPKVNTSSNSGNEASCEDAKKTFIEDTLSDDAGMSCQYGIVMENALSEEKCLIIQLNYDGINDPKLFTNFKHFAVGNANSKSIEVEISKEDLNVNKCPMDLFVKYEETVNFSGDNTAPRLKISLKNTKGKYKMVPLKKSTKQQEELRLLFQPIDISSCEDLFGDDNKLINQIKTIKNIIIIAIPILLIGLGVSDFAKAVFASSEDDIRKAQAKFIKRVIIAVAIFLIPSVLRLVLTIANGIWGNIDTTFCGIL